jgi:uncharacterized membrane protein
MARHKRDIALLIVALLGIAFSLYAITLHYSPDPHSVCNINETFNCDKVNKSPWSVFLGVPVAIWGAISYLFVFLIVLKKKAIKHALDFTDRDFAQYFLLLVAVMFLFQLYLTLAEIFWIHAYCLVCLASQVCTLLLLLVGTKDLLVIKRREKREQKAKEKEKKRK